MSNSSELLYNLQLHIQQKWMNLQRKSDEAKRMKQSFGEQVNEYIQYLYYSSCSIWQFSYNQSISVNKKEITNKKEIKMMDENQKEKLLAFFDNFFGNVNDKIGTCSNGHISYELFLLVLSYFHFLWSEESVNDFKLFLKKLDKEKREMFYFCLTMQPSTIIYLKNCLKEVLDHFHKKSINELVELIKANMLKFASLLPGFLKEFFGAEGKGCGKIFWERILKTFISAPFLFNLCNSDFLLFSIDKTNQLKDKLFEFFNSDEGDKLISEVISCDNNLSMLPSLKLLKNVYPDVEQITIFNPRAFDAKECNFQKQQIPNELFKLSIDKLNNKVEEKNDHSDETLEFLVRKVLLKSRLLKLQSVFDTPSDYFQAIVSLSMINDDSDLEEDLEKLLILLSQNNSITIKSLCESIEKQLLEDDKKSEDKILRSLTEYSQQQQFLTNLQEIPKNVQKNAVKAFDFYNMYRIYFQLMDELKERQPTAEDIIQNPQCFIDFFCQCVEKFNSVEKKKISSEKIQDLYSILLYDTKVWDVFLNIDEIKNYDKQIQQFIKDESEFLYLCHQADYLDIYKNDNSKLEMFTDEFQLAFECSQPFERIFHIHSAYQILGGLLQVQGINEVGADQIVPFGIISTIHANPLGLASTSIFISKFITPLLSGYSPIDHAEEYSLIQFVSTFHFLEEKFVEKTGIVIHV